MGFWRGLNETLRGCSQLSRSIEAFFGLANLSRIVLTKFIFSRKFYCDLVPKFLPKSSIKEFIKFGSPNAIYNALNNFRNFPTFSLLGKQI